MSETTEVPRTNGATAAALMAAGLGCATLGVATTWAEASPGTADALNWWPPVGPLTGKAGTATGVFFASWLLLHRLWRRRGIRLRPIVIGSGLLLVAGLIGTFPPFFQSAAHREAE